LPGLIGSFHPGGPEGPGGPGGGMGGFGAHRGGERPMLVLYPGKTAEKNQWMNPDRLEFFESLVLTPFIEQRYRQRAYQMQFETIGEKIFIISNDPETGDIYLFEGNRKMDAPALFQLKEMKNLYFHLNIGLYLNKKWIRMG
jgi:hypothetical protein